MLIVMAEECYLVAKVHRFLFLCEFHSRSWTLWITHNRFVCGSLLPSVDSSCLIWCLHKPRAAKWIWDRDNERRLTDDLWMAGRNQEEEEKQKATQNQHLVQERTLGSKQCMGGEREEWTSEGVVDACSQ